jgi:O-antigen ligase
MSAESGIDSLSVTQSDFSAWLALTCAAIGGIVVLTLGMDPRTGVGILVLGISLTLVVIRLKLVVYAIVAATVILVDGWLITRSVEDVPFRLGLGRLYLLEIPIFVLCLAYVVRHWTTRNRAGFQGMFVPTALNLCLYAWLIAFPIFAIYGLLLGHPLQDAIGYYEWRCLLIAILFYFFVTSLFQSYKDLHKLWTWFFLLATLKSFYSLTLAITKIDPPLPLVFGQGPVGEGPESTVYLFAALPALAILLFRVENDAKWKVCLLFGALVMIADLALSQKRDPQLAFLIGLAVLAWHLPRREKIRWGIRVACLAIVITISGVFANLGSTNSGIGASLSRYGEIIDFIQAPGENIAAGDTFLFHIFDIIDGWEKIKERPLFGQGFGGQTERNLTLLPGTGGADIGTGMIHNQYLTFWLKMGIAGPILMLWLMGGFLLFCRRKLRYTDPSFATATVIGICAAVWSDAAMEMSGAQWTGNTKTPIVMFLGMALAIGFLRFCCGRERDRFRETNA